MRIFNATAHSNGELVYWLPVELRHDGIAVVVWLIGDFGVGKSWANVHVELLGEEIIDANSTGPGLQIGRHGGVTCVAGSRKYKLQFLTMAVSCPERGGPSLLIGLPADLYQGGIAFVVALTHVERPILPDEPAAQAGRLVG